jgi:hypothetical protein
MRDRNVSPGSRFAPWGWAFAALCAAALLLAGLLARERPLPVAAATPGPQFLPGVPPMPRIAANSAKPPPASPLATVEICGQGAVAIDAGDAMAVGRYLNATTAKARRRWLAALLDSDDYRARASGLFLQGKLTEEGDIQPDAEQARDALVQLAVGAGDPAVYALAVYACDTDASPAASVSCRRIKLNTWAAMDPDNAVPWLLLSGDAHANGDLATETDAFARAAKAHKADAYNYSLYQFSESALPRDVTSAERWYLATELIGVEAATASRQYSIASRHCAGAALQENAVRERCAALAELMVAQGTSLLDLAIGANIGARAGWPAQRIADLKQERSALMQAITQATYPSDGNQWSCEAVRLGNAYMSQWVRLGEVGAAHEALDRSGETLQELAQKQQASMDKIARDARREAASAPDAASSEAKEEAP